MSEQMGAREVLAQAIWASEEPVMSWGFVNEKRRGEYRHQADCALKALGANRYAVVELPDPDIESSINNLRVSEWSPGYETIRVYTQGEIEVSWGLSSDITAADSLREMAGACLAAAAAAERDSEER